MTFYNIHTHARQEGVVSILNVFPEEYSGDELGFVSCGFHPWYVDGNESFERLEYIIQQRNVVAIGETGYDALRGSSLEVQKESFEKHIKLSEYYRKPMIIHCVKAWGWLIASHKKWKPKQAWIIHGFRGKPEQMKQLLEKGMLFSFGEKFNDESVRLIPIDRIFCETDDSDVEIGEIYKLIANRRDVAPESLSDDIRVNIERVFKVSI